MLYLMTQLMKHIQTVPPKGVNPLTAQQVEDFDSNPVDPVHTLLTHYRYNSLNQLIRQTTLDAGESQFWYNDTGQLRLSQNAVTLSDTRDQLWTRLDEVNGHLGLYNGNIS